MVYIGVDLGGTKIAAGVVNDNCEILCKDSIPSGASRPAAEIAADMADLCRNVAKKSGVDLADVAWIGIGSPGSIDRENGVILYANNINFLKTPLAALIREHWDIPVHIDNDANAAALGEAYAGAAKGCRDAIMITLGTGVGGGIIIDRKIYSGFNANGAELGHMVIVASGRPCTCGRNGCWEAYASVSGLIADTRAAMLAHPESAMWQLQNGSIEHVSGKTAFDAARAGDAVAEEVVRQYREYVAIGITNLVNIFQPEVLCVGGAISKEGEYLLGPVREFVERERYTRYCAQTEIKIAALGNDAGIIGAAMLGKSV
ncbi:MAG: ROK family glucokinase [Clostridiaceae bacterium]|nr:ROK family glucokinase [Clostridiaceae bacterium]